MVALDSQFHLPAVRPRLNLPLLAGAAALVLVLGAVAVRGFTDNGFRLGSQLAWRFTSLVLFAALTGGPAARLLARTRFALDEARLVRDLIWAFCASYGVYLAAVLLPNVLGPDGASAGALLFALTGGAAAAAMAAMADGWAVRMLGRRAQHTILGVAAIYFWLCYGLMALAHLSGPHRPDGFYGFSLCLMILALLVRFADRFAQELRRGASTLAAPL